MIWAIIAISYSFITTCTTTRMVIVGMTNFVWKAWFCCHVVTRCCCYKIICPYFSFSWKWFCIIILLTIVGIMSDRILYSPRPDIPRKTKFQELISNLIGQPRNMIKCKHILTQPVSYLFKKIWSGPHASRWPYIMLSFSPLSQALFHCKRIFLLFNFVPQQHPTISKSCETWSLVTWTDLLDFIHSWTAACSLSIILLSRSLDTYKST